MKLKTLKQFDDLFKLKVGVISANLNAYNLARKSYFGKEYGVMTCKEYKGHTQLEHGVHVPVVPTPVSNALDTLDIIGVETELPHYVS